MLLHWCTYVRTHQHSRRLSIVIISVTCACIERHMFAGDISGLAHALHLHLHSPFVCHGASSLMFLYLSRSCCCLRCCLIALVHIRLPRSHFVE